MGVANIANLSLISDVALADGAEVMVDTLGQPWVLHKAMTDAPNGPDGITVAYALSAGGVPANPGRWMRKLSPVPKWTDQTTWYVNAGTGSDEFTGTSATVDGGGVGPLKTVAEFTRRVRTAKYGTGFAGYTINLGSNIGLYSVALGKYTDSFQWDFSLETTAGLMNQDQDSGITRSILQINGSKTDALNDGTVKIAGTTVTFDNAKSKIQRNAGAFAVGDVVEFQHLATTIDAASDGQALPQGTIFVASTANAPAAGTILVTSTNGVQTITYTGKTVGPDSFTGCVGGTGTLATGGAVQIVTPASGKRIYVLAIETIDAANDTATINPWTLQGALPVDTQPFKTYTLTKWGPQISGYGTQGQHRIQIDNVELPGLATPGAPDGIPAVLADGDGCPDYELGGYVVRFRNTLSRISITGGIGGRVRWGHNNTNPVAIIKPALIAAPGTLQNSFMTIERGDVIANYVSFVNCIVDVMNVRGILTLSRSCFVNGCIRMGLKGAGSVSQTQAGPTFVRLDRVSIWDVPTTVGANPFVGGDGDPGAAIIMKRGSAAQVRAIYGSSVNATTKGIDISEGSSLWLQDFAGLPSTVTGNGANSDIMIDGGATIPVIVAGLPAAGSVIQTWANLAGFGEVCMNLKNGTRIVKVA